MTVDRLNDHVKRATGVTAGHLIRQRVLTEAKRQLVFTRQPIQEIAEELAFSDPSHFAGFSASTPARPRMNFAINGGKSGPRHCEPEAKQSSNDAETWIASSVRSSQ